MGNWSETDWITAALFASVTSLGGWFWLKFIRANLQPGSAGFGCSRACNVRWGLVDVLTVAFIWIASQAVAGGLLVAAYDLPAGAAIPPGTSARIALVSGLAQLVCVGFAFAWLMRRYDHDDQDFGLDKTQWRVGIIQGFKGFCMWVPLVWLLQSFLVRFIKYQHPSFDRVNESGEFLTLTDVWITAVLLAPIIEEILFRGVLQSWLQRFSAATLRNPTGFIAGGPDEIDRLQPTASRPSKIHWPAILITAAVFGLAHYSQGPAPYSLFVFSLGLGYLYQRSGNLLACIIMHMILNAITMTLFTIEQSGIF